MSLKISLPSISTASTSFAANFCEMITKIAHRALSALNAAFQFISSLFFWKSREITIIKTKQAPQAEAHPRTPDPNPEPKKPKQPENLTLALVEAPRKKALSKQEALHALHLKWMMAAVLYDRDRPVYKIQNPTYPLSIHLDPRAVKEIKRLFSKPCTDLIVYSPLNFGPKDSRASSSHALAKKQVPAPLQPAASAITYALADEYAPLARSQSSSAESVLIFDIRGPARALSLNPQPQAASAAALGDVGLFGLSRTDASAPSAASLDDQASILGLRRDDALLQPAAAPATTAARVEHEGLSAYSLHPVNPHPFASLAGAGVLPNTTVLEGAAASAAVRSDEGAMHNAAALLDHVAQIALVPHEEPRHSAEAAASAIHHDPAPAAAALEAIVDEEEALDPFEQEQRQLDRLCSSLRVVDQGLDLLLKFNEVKAHVKSIPASTTKVKFWFHLANVAQMAKSHPIFLALSYGTKLTKFLANLPDWPIRLGYDAFIDPLLRTKDINFYLPILEKISQSLQFTADVIDKRAPTVRDYLDDAVDYLDILHELGTLTGTEITRSRTSQAPLYATAEEFRSNSPFIRKMRLEDPRLQALIEAKEVFKEADLSTRQALSYLQRNCRQYVVRPVPLPQEKRSLLGYIGSAIKSGVQAAGKAAAGFVRENGSSFLPLAQRCLEHRIHPLNVAQVVAVNEMHDATLVIFRKNVVRLIGTKASSLVIYTINGWIIMPIAGWMTEKYLPLSQNPSENGILTTTADVLFRKGLVQTGIETACGFVPFVAQETCSEKVTNSYQFYKTGTSVYSYIMLGMQLLFVFMALREMFKLDRLQAAVNGALYVTPESVRQRINGYLVAQNRAYARVQEARIAPREERQAVISRFFKKIFCKRS
jgi:hypothetical protein